MLWTWTCVIVHNVTHARKHASALIHNNAHFASVFNLSKRTKQISIKRKLFGKMLGKLSCSITNFVSALSSNEGKTKGWLFMPGFNSFLEFRIFDEADHEKFVLHKLYFSARRWRTSWISDSEVFIACCVDLMSSISTTNIWISIRQQFSRPSFRSSAQFHFTNGSFVA